MLCAKFDWNWPIGSGEEDEYVEKFTTKRDKEEGQISIRKAHLSLQIKWAKEI